MTNDRCENENESGHRCAYGPGHRCKCLYKPWHPTDAQWAVLENIDLPTNGVRKFQCIGRSTVSSLRALEQRGFIGLRYVNSRTWDAWLTPAGRRILIDRPR